MAADAVTYAQKHGGQSEEHDRILGITRSWILNITQHQDLGPFSPQSATLKNLAVSFLTTKGALQREDALLGGLSALLKYIERPESVHDKQLPYIKSTLLPQVVTSLHKNFAYSRKRLSGLMAAYMESQATAEGADKVLRERARGVLKEDKMKEKSTSREQKKKKKKEKKKKKNKEKIKT